MSILRPRSAALVVVALALFSDTLLYYLLVPLLPAYAKTFGLGQVRIGVLFWSYAVSLLMFTYPLGRLGDRFGRRSIMLLGLLGLGTTTLLFAFSTNYLLLVFARILQGLSATATWTSGMALVAVHFPSEERGKAMGTVFAFANLGVLLGPPLSGLLSQHFGMQAPFIAGAILVLLDGLARAFLLQEVQMERGVHLGFLDFLRDRSIRVFAGAMALGAGMWALLESTLPLHFDSALALSPVLIGLCFAASALAHMVTSPFIGALSDRYGRGGVLIVGMLLAMVLIPAPIFPRHLAGVIVAMVGLGVTASFIMSPVSPAMAEAVARRGSSSYASVYGLLNLAYATGMLVGPLLGSLLVHMWGIRIALVLVGLGFGAYVLVIRGQTLSAQ